MSASSEMREQQRLQNQSSHVYPALVSSPLSIKLYDQCFHVAHKVCVDFVAGESIILTTKVAESKLVLI